MDKRVIFAVAGSGKTTYITDNLRTDKRSLIVTYTNGNYKNLHKKILSKFGGKWPESITLMTYFSFLYKFCHKPFLADKLKAKGLCYNRNPKERAKQTELDYYMSPGRYLYSNRAALLLEKTAVIDRVKGRLEMYFDEFVVDEVQDIAGRDFTLLESLMEANLGMLFVGDFYQHTFDTSRDGNANGTLFKEKAKYEARFTSKGLQVDNASLRNSWRCSENVCAYIRDSIGIRISSNRSNLDNTSVEYVSDATRIESILDDKQIVKLHYQNASKYGNGHKNWGKTKGEDHHNDVCILLNKNSSALYHQGKLNELPQSTKNKLYVAITRARGNIYLMDETCLL